MRQQKNNARAELYYLRKSGEVEVLGPFAVIELRQKIECGEVKKNDEISRDQIKWVTAETAAPKLFRRMKLSKSDMQDGAESQKTKEEKAAVRMSAANTQVKKAPRDEHASQGSPSRQKINRLDHLYNAETKLADTTASQDTDSQGISRTTTKNSGEQDETRNVFDADRTPLATVRLTLLLTTFMDEAKARLFSSQFFSEVASVLTWRSASSIRMESQRTTTQLLSIGLFTQVLVMLLTQASGGILVVLGGLLLTPVYVAARVFTAIWICSLFGVFFEWRGNVLQREISLTGLLMVAGGILELILACLACAANVAMSISLTVGATLHVYLKCLLFVRFLLSQSIGSQEFRGRLFWLGVAGQFVVTITFMLLIAAGAALYQMSAS